MKRRFLISFLVIGVIFCFHVVYAADEYSFDLQYTGSVIKGVEKEASVMLKGDNGPLYEHVRIKVDVEGPATPKILAYDSNGTETDIATTGYWGPEAGFAVQGTFTNTTPLKVTFPEEGKYEITLSLIDINNANNIIVTKNYTVDVLAEVPDHNNTTNEIVNVVNEVVEKPNEMVNTNVEELPTTGTTVWEYTIYAMVLMGIVGAGYVMMRRSKQNG